MCIRDRSIGYTPRCRSLGDLHYRGPQAQGSVSSVETEPRCVTDLYNGQPKAMATSHDQSAIRYVRTHSNVSLVTSNITTIHSGR